MFSNIRYVLLTATRDRLFIGLLIGIVAAAYISSVLGSTAMLETEQMTIAFSAASARVIIMVGIIVFIGFHMRNAFDAREIDVLLSRPISRTTLVLSYWVGFCAVAACLVVPTQARERRQYIMLTDALCYYGISYLAAPEVFERYLPQFHAVARSIRPFKGRAITGAAAAAAVIKQYND